MPKLADPEQLTHPADAPLLLRREAVARLIDVKPRTFDRLVSSGGFPAADVRLNAKLVRWRRSTVEAWIAQPH